MSVMRKIALAAISAATATGLLIGAAGSAGAAEREPGPLRSLVQQEIITKEQARAVKDALADAKGDVRSELQASALTALVTAGVLSQVEAATLASADRGAVRDLLQGRELTRADREAIRTALRSAVDQAKARAAAERTAAVNGLVADGTLTDSQAAQVLAAIDAARETKPRPVGRS